MQYIRIYPVNGTAFVWGAVGDATSYVLQIGTATGQSDVVNLNVGNVITYTAALIPGGYFSRVVIVGGVQDGELTAGGQQAFTVS